MAIVHAFTSAVADGGNASLVQPSDWNDDHTITTAEVTPATGDKIIIKDVSNSDALAHILVSALLAMVVDSAPGALDTLNELAAALGDDANYATTVTNALALKAPLASPALTGNPTAPTQSPADNSTKIATTAYADAAASGGSVSASSSTTFTNKTLDAEATGNVLTISEKIWLPAAGVNGAVPAPMWDLPAANAPTPTLVAGSNVIKGVLSFADAGNSSAQITLKLPSDWVGAIDAKIIWRTSAASGNCKWSLATNFASLNAAQVDDNAFNTADTVTTSAPGTTLYTQESDITGINITGAAANKLFHLKISRDGTDGSDTIGSAAELIGVEITWRRTI